MTTHTHRCRDEGNRPARVSGAIQKSESLTMIAKNGFVNVTIQKEKAITIPNDILQNYLPAADTERFNRSSLRIFSIAVYAEKPVAAKACGCNDGCC